MRRLGKVALGVVAAAITAPLLFTATMYASGWYYRWRARQLLAVVRHVTPGVTTQAEYMHAVTPFAGPNTEVKQEDGNRWVVLLGAVAMPNRFEWEEDILEHLGPVAYFAEDKLIAPGTVFTVMPKFEDGVVAQFHVEESQGSGHPYGAWVDVYAKRYEGESSHLDEDFTGYKLSQMHRGENGPVWESNVDFDERATRNEVSRALDFRFECFTDIRGCEDGEKFLQPAPNR